MANKGFGASPAAANADVVASAVAAHGELAVGIDAVMADAEVLAEMDALAGGRNLLRAAASTYYRASDSSM